MYIWRPELILPFKIGCIILTLSSSNYEKPREIVKFYHFVLMKCYSKSSKYKEKMSAILFILIFTSLMFFTCILQFAYYIIKIKVDNIFFCFSISVSLLKNNYYVLKKYADKI